MGKRLSDTAALAGPAYSLSGSQERTIAVRKIDNGYIVRESSYNDGNYSSCEHYSKTAPNLGENKAENPMKRAKDYMERE